jgi:tRNA A-37 threonylcarbamoyl transferase component Bud32
MYYNHREGYYHIDRSTTLAEMQEKCEELCADVFVIYGASRNIIIELRRVNGFIYSGFTKRVGLFNAINRLYQLKLRARGRRDEEAQ